MGGFNLAGVISLIIILMGLTGYLGAASFSGVEILENQQVSADVDRLLPQAYNEWTQTIGAEVASQGQTGPYPAPTPAQFSMCDASNPECGLVGSIAFTDGTFGAGAATDTFAAVEQATGVYCPSWSEAQRVSTATLSVANEDGSVLGKRNVTFLSRLTCGSPYIASTTITDDSGRSLYAGNVARVGDTGGGCDPGDPQNCDTLTQTYGSGSVSDTREHAALECAGIYCTSSDGLESVDSFQTQMTTNSAETTGQPR